MFTCLCYWGWWCNVLEFSCMNPSWKYSAAQVWTCCSIASCIGLSFNLPIQNEDQVGFCADMASRLMDPPSTLQLKRFGQPDQLQRFSVLGCLYITNLPCDSNAVIFTWSWWFSPGLTVLRTSYSNFLARFSRFGIDSAEIRRQRAHIKTARLRLSSKRIPIVLLKRGRIRQFWAFFRS